MTIYFLTPDYTFPSGGVRVIYRHVDILNAHGIPAYVLHRKIGHRCTWFQNNTPVVYVDSRFKRRISSKVRKYLKLEQPHEMHLLGAPSLKIGTADILVLPEIDGPNMTQMAPSVPKIILNQGCYLTFRSYSIEKEKLLTPYLHPEFRAVITNSEDGFNYLHYVFPKVKLGRFHPAIDPQLFKYSADKKRQVCFTTRKNEGIMRQVINILKFRNALNGFELIPFSGIPQQKVADIFRDSAIYLSFSTYEGFGLPPAEAMASGCLVIGFHGGGGREFFRPEFCYPIEYGDVLGFAGIVEEVISTYDTDPKRFANMAKAASDYILKTYTPQREEQDIINFWSDIIAADRPVKPS
jgi:hypothetical protein